MKNNLFGKNSLIIANLTLLVIVLWISLEAFQIFSHPETTIDTQKQINPLDPNLSQPAINRLEDRLTFNEEELNQFVIIEERTEAPEEAETDLEDEVAETEAGLVSTPSGDLE